MAAAQEILEQALLLPWDERNDLAIVLLRGIASQDLLQQALLLSHDDRTDLARLLLRSLDSETSQADYQAAWQREIIRRVNRLDEGKSATFDWREAHAEIRSKLREQKS